MNSTATLAYISAGEILSLTNYGHYWLIFGLKPELPKIKTSKCDMSEVVEHADHKLSIDDRVDRCEAS